MRFTLIAQCPTRDISIRLSTTTCKQEIYKTYPALPGKGCKIFNDSAVATTVLYLSNQLLSEGGKNVGSLISFFKHSSCCSFNIYLEGLTINGLHERSLNRWLMRELISRVSGPLVKYHSSQNCSFRDRLLKSSLLIYNFPSTMSRKDR